MTLNERIITALVPLGISVDVTEHTPDGAERFCVIIPAADNFECCGDDRPLSGTETAELALYCKGNYLAFKDAVLKLLVDADITITNARYLEFEDDTNYHHYIFEVAVVRDYEEVFYGYDRT